MKNISAIISSVLVILLYPILTSANSISAGVIDVRSTNGTNTCGDPYQTMTYYSAYNQVTTTHTLYILPVYIILQATDNTYLINAPSFRAWSIDAGPSQPGTTPFFCFKNYATAEFLFLINPNGGSTPPPAPSGFTFQYIIGYVYPTQICGSVPLYVVSNPSANDHVYTVDALERDYYINHATGWIDQGVAAYVLPLNAVNL